MSDAGTTKKWGQQAGRGMPRKPAFPQKNNEAATKKFAGRCNELEGHIFDCG